jgi:hypothetical protein
MIDLRRFRERGDNPEGSLDDWVTNQYRRRATEGDALPVPISPRTGSTMLKLFCPGRQGGLWGAKEKADHRAYATAVDL